MTRLIIFSFLLSILPSAIAQKKLTRQDYITKYAPIAIKEMTYYGIPASITLAQGCLESGNGNSALAAKSNNHFGIKCHEWTGKKVYHDDDKKNECFRVYKNPEQSFEDHSLFLVNRTRYAKLFELKITDYKGWAKGLKAAGYATDPKYPNKLIAIIEEHELYKYDNASTKRRRKKSNLQETSSLKTTKHNSPKKNINSFSISAKDAHQTLELNRVKYIIVRKGDTFESINNEFELRNWELTHYNNLEDNYTLQEDDKLFIQAKRGKAAKHNTTHRIEDGETMHSISQLYAVKLKRLYRLNRMSIGSNLKEGQILQLRKRIKK